MTSAVKRVDQSVFLTAKSVKDGKFKGGTDAVFNLKNAGVGVGKIDARVPKAFIKRMNALRPLLISGKIKAPSKL
jgi:basic membrane protein A